MLCGQCISHVSPPHEQIFPFLVHSLSLPHPNPLFLNYGNLHKCDCWTPDGKEQKREKKELFIQIMPGKPKIQEHIKWDLFLEWDRIIDICHITGLGDGSKILFIQVSPWVLFVCLFWMSCSCFWSETKASEMLLLFCFFLFPDFAQYTFCSCCS